MRTAPLQGARPSAHKEAKAGMGSIPPPGLFDAEPGGFIVLSRRFFRRWPWQLSDPHLRVFLWLLYRARWSAEPSRVVTPAGPITVERGQLWTTYRTLAKEAGVGLQSVRTALKLFQREGAISTQQLTRMGTLITVCNYDTYQAVQHTPNTAASTTPTHPQHNKNQGNQGTKRKTSKSTRPTKRALELVNQYETVSGWTANDAAKRSAQRLLNQGVDPDVLTAAASRYHRQLQENPPSAHRFVTKPHNWFGEKASWKEHAAPEPHQVVATMTEPERDQPQGGKVSTAYQELLAADTEGRLKGCHSHNVSRGAVAVAEGKQTPTEALEAILARQADYPARS